MKRSFVVFLGVVLVSGIYSASAQVVPSAYSNRASIWAGGEGSYFQPDYAGQGVAQSSPQHLYGIGAFVDADFTRWIQIEGEGRWLHWNQYAGIDQNTYMVGPRVPIHEFRRFTPYGKFLIGFGSGTFLTGRTTAWAYGGGADYHVGRKFNLRGEYEYQNWRVTPTLHPSGFNVGLSYRVW